MESKNLSLIIERSKDGLVWGRTTYQNHLMVENAKTLDLLIKKMKGIFKKEYSLAPETIQFEIEYDVSSLFQHKPFLNITAIAHEVGINPALMRQYVSGVKNPSSDRVKKIEGVINQLGKQLREVRLAIAR